MSELDVWTADRGPAVLSTDLSPLDCSCRPTELCRLGLSRLDWDDSGHLLVLTTKDGPSCPVSFRPVQSYPVPSPLVPSRPVISRPVPSRPVPSRPVPSHPIPSQSRPIPSRPSPVPSCPAPNTSSPARPLHAAQPGAVTRRPTCLLTKFGPTA